VKTIAIVPAAGAGKRLGLKTKKPFVLLGGKPLISYALSALGFVLIYKSSRVLNMAHGQIIAAGAFITYALTVQVGIPIYISFLLIARSVASHQNHSRLLLVCLGWNRNLL